MARKILIARSMKKADAFPYGGHRLKYLTGDYSPLLTTKSIRRRFYIRFNRINEQCTLFLTFSQG